MSEGNEIQQKTTPGLVELDQKELQAVQLRYLGKTSGEIAVATGYNDNYIRNLFMNGGRLEKAYRDFALEQQKKAHESVCMALNSAREEALQAMERIIALSKDASNEAAIFKANEYLLNLAGINSKLTLRSFFQNLSSDDARKLVDDLFRELYGEPHHMTITDLAKKFSVEGAKQIECNEHC